MFSVSNTLISLSSVEHKNKRLWEQSLTVLMPRRVFFPQTVCLTLGVLTVVVKGRVARSRWRTEFVAIYVLLCLDVQFSWQFSYFSGGRGGRARDFRGNFRSFRLFNFFDVHFSW